MKHVKLFEAFGNQASNPVITATGDWSRLVMDGTPMEWVHPDTLVVTYHTNPTPVMAKEASKYGTITPDESVDEIVGGDQNGGNITQRDGMVKFLADPSYNPEDYENEFGEVIDSLNNFRLKKNHIIRGGGGRSDIPKLLEQPLNEKGWSNKEFKIKILIDNKEKKIDTHEIDCFKNEVGLEIEWNK